MLLKEKRRSVTMIYAWKPSCTSLRFAATELAPTHKLLSYGTCVTAATNKSPFVLPLQHIRACTVVMHHSFTCSV